MKWHQIRGLDRLWPLLVYVFILDVVSIQETNLNFVGQVPYLLRLLCNLSPYVVQVAAYYRAFLILPFPLALVKAQSL